MTTETDARGRDRRAAVDPATSSTTSRPGGSAPPNPTRPPRGWRVRPDVKAAILACFAIGRPRLGRRAAHLPRPGDGPAARRLADGPWRIVPGGTAVRRGAHLGDGVVVMPPSYVNIGAWVGDGDDGRFARPGRVLRPDRGARPPRGRRHHRRRARAARAPARSSSRTTRSSGGLRPARRRPRRARGGHRRRGDPDRARPACTTSSANGCSPGPPTSRWRCRPARS